MICPSVTPRFRRCLGSWRITGEFKAFEKDTAMTIEIFYLTAQIQHWLNLRVARHLAAQAARLAH